MFESLCPPALIFLVFGLAHVILSIFKVNNMLAMKQFLMTLLFTTLLNFLCERNLNIVSWILIAIPFFIMAFSVLNKKISEYREKSKLTNTHNKRDIILYHDHGEDYDDYNHGIGDRSIDEAGKPIDEERNYKYDLDSSFDGINQMRFIRDQRLSTY